MSSISSTLRGASTLLGSTIALYTLVAACSAGAGGGSGAFSDAMTNPVGTASANGVTPGSRLKATYITGADGSKVVTPNQFWDSEREELCSFMPVSGGDMYCLPWASSGRFSTSKRAVYSDKNCTREAPGNYGFEACDSTPKYVQEYDFGCGLGLIALYEKSNNPDGPGYSKISGGGCASESSGDPSRRQVGAKIPFSAFAKGTAGHD